MKLPQLHILYAYPLDRDRRELFAKKELGEYPSQEEVIQTVNEWRGIWNEVNENDRIMERFTQLTGVNLSRDLELFVFGGGLKAMSMPLMMPINMQGGKRMERDRFIETVIHEIAHKFASGSNPELKKYWDKIYEDYKEEAIYTKNHIIVYALLLIVLKEVLGEEKMEELIIPSHPEYQRALDIARERGPESVIADLKEFTK
jgi:hypothetical protein